VHDLTPVTDLPTTPVRVGADHVLPSTNVRNLGIFIDIDVTMQSQVSRTVCPGVSRFCGSCAASDVQCPTPCSKRWSLRWLCHASTRQRDTSGTPSLPASSTPVSSQCCSLQADTQVTCYERITPLLRDLHWLRSPERIDFKLAVLVYRCLHSLAAQYLSDYFQLVAYSNRRRLRSS